MAPYLSLADQRRLRIFLPPIGEQNAMAGVLESLDDKIAVNDRIAAVAGQLADSLLEQLASSNLQWRPAQLGKIAAVNARKADPSEGWLRYIDISSVSGGKVKWPNRIPWSKAPGRARRRVKPGDIIWSTVRPRRRSHLLILDDDPELIVSTGFAVLTPRTIGPALLYGLVIRDNFVNYLEGAVEGSAYPTVRPDHFANARLLLPPEDIADAFENEAMPLRARAHAAHVENRTLVMLRDTLLPRLFSGELRIKDAERWAKSAV